MNEHIIKIPIYDATLCIVDSKNVSKALIEIKGNASDDDSSYSSYLFYDHENTPANWWLCIDFKDLDMGVLVHELFHATHRILEYFDVKFTSENHEPFAYLMEYLFNECINLKNK